jgi:uncharacterized protein (DUF983 family)
VNWDLFICPMCGGKAFMGILSLVARCEDCGAYNTEISDYGKPITWVKDEVVEGNAK